MRSLALAALLAGSAAAFDLPWKAGTPAELVYQIEPTGNPSIDRVLAERSVAALRRRLDAFGLKGSVEPRASGRIVVVLDLKGDSPEALLRPLVRPSTLEFRLALPDKKKPGPGETLAPETTLDPATQELRRTDLVVEKAVRLSGADIEKARAVLMPPDDSPAIAIEFTPAGARRLEALTEANIGRMLTTLWDGRVMSQARIHDKISGGKLQLTGAFTLGEVEDVARTLSSGYIPADAKLVSQTVAGKSVPLPSEETAAARPAPRPAAAAPPEPPVPVTEVDTAPPLLPRGRVSGAAVVIGVERTRQGLPRADFAARDARIFADYLIKTLGYPEENVAVLLDERAAKSDLEKYLEDWLPRKAAAGATIVVYYSGHGAPDPTHGTSYLVPYDGDPAFLAKTAYPLARLTSTLGKMKGSRSLVLLDACFSGAGRRSALAKGARPLVSLVALPEPPSGVAVLTASASDQIGGAYDEKGHGIFTYFVLEALRDSAAQGVSPTLEDLHRRVSGRVEAAARRLSGNEQTPQLQAPGGSGRVPF